MGDQVPRKTGCGRIDDQYPANDTLIAPQQWKIECSDENNDHLSAYALFIDFTLEIRENFPMFACFPGEMVDNVISERQLNRWTNVYVYGDIGRYITQRNRTLL